MSAQSNAFTNRKRALGPDPFSPVDPRYFQSLSCDVLVNTLTIGSDFEKTSASFRLRQGMVGRPETGEISNNSILGGMKWQSSQSKTSNGIDRTIHLSARR